MGLISIFQLVQKKKNKQSSLKTNVHLIIKETGQVPGLANIKRKKSKDITFKNKSWKNLKLGLKQTICQGGN